jgi:hypothetical protein
VKAMTNHSDPITEWMLLLEARKDEQLSTGTLRFKPDKDGDYGAVYYFIPGEDTVKPQRDRIAELEAALKNKKGSPHAD